MAVEGTRYAYYDSIMTGKNFFSMKTCIQICTKDYLSNVFFGGDYKRVTYTNPEYAFRKRIEELSQGIEEQIFINNLQLPFASFYITSMPKITKSCSASEWNGYYDEELEYYLHFSNILQTVKVQFFFDRSDDLEVAHLMALNEMHSGASMKYLEEVYWRNKTLKLPVFLKIKDIKVGNDVFNESQWLEQAHMHAMTLEVEVESAQIHINRGLNAVRLPFKWRITGREDDWYDGQTEYFTQKSILMFSEKQWGMDMKTCSTTSKAIEEITPAIALQPYKDCDEMTLKQIASVIPNRACAEMVEGYFTSQVKVLMNRLKYNAEKTTIDEKGEVTACIDFVVKPSTYQYWKRTDVIVPTRTGGPIVITNCKDKEVLINGLHPNSHYKIFFILRDINETFNTIELEFTTPVWEKEIVPGLDKAGEGITEDNPDTKPKDVPVQGLIGMGGEMMNDVYFDESDLSGLEL